MKNVSPHAISGAPISFEATTTSTPSRELLMYSVIAPWFTGHSLMMLKRASHIMHASEQASGGGTARPVRTSGRLTTSRPLERNSCPRRSPVGAGTESPDSPDYPRFASDFNSDSPDSPLLAAGSL